MRPIDADALLEALNAHEYLGESEYFTGAQDAHDSIVEAIKLMKSLDYVPVVHAHWKLNSLDDQDDGCYYCSNCKSAEYYPECVPFAKYCSECGAKMDNAD